MLTVILAGGASRRMGRDKATLPYGGGTLLQYQIDRYRALGPVAVSVARAGAYPFTGALELVDRYPDAGPLNGLLSGFSTGAAELLLTAVDLPGGDLALARRLAELRGGADLCMLRRGEKGLEPLFAVYGRSCAAAAEACLRAGELAMTALLARCSVRYVLPEELPEFDLDRCLRNVNTPEDYARLLRETAGC